MKKKFFLALIFSFFAMNAFAEHAIDSELLTEKINTVLTSFGENINIGIYVKDAQTGKVLYKKDVDRYFMPASNQKLFTAFAALQYLGSDFKFQTQLFADYKKIKDNTLKDNLYLQFSGDPTLTAAQLETLIHSLNTAGIRRIKGKIIIDDTVFDQMAMSPGTSWEDQDFCWGSPLSSLIVNHNCASATLKPAANPEQPAILELPDYPQSMTFISQVMTKAATEKKCRIKAKRSGQTTYTLSGCITVGAKPQLIEMAINDPRGNLLSLLNYSLEKNQIKVPGGFEFKKFAAFPKPFATQESPPLKAMVSTMLKESDNTIADSLFKTMGATYAHETGSFTNGSNAVRGIIGQSLPFTLPKNTLIDGSGLSRYNFLTPEQIVSVLQKIYQSPSAADFIASLPVAGVDGTLKDWLRDPAVLGKVYAKTGSETAITSLSGFLQTKNKQMLIFSILINGYTGPAAKYKTLEEKFCKVLVEAN